MNPVELPAAIQTERLLLRGPVPDDTAEFHTALVESLPALRLWFAWAEPTPTLETSAMVVEGAYRGFQQCRQLDWLIFLKDAPIFIGVINFHSAHLGIVDWSRSTQLLMYWLRTGYTGQGYMTEAAGALVDLAFSVPTITRLEIHCNVANTRSAAVAKRLGFVYHRTIPDGVTFDDVYVKER